MTASGPAFSVGGEEVRVDYAAIEKSLSDLWRNENKDGQAVTRAALWNVVAHTWGASDHARASQIMSIVAAAVPQRTIVIRSEPSGSPAISSWISANCHLIGPEKQVCSEEVAIVAGGDRIDRVPPLVNALLLPDMPVAMWWHGDLPNTQSDYVDSLLEPADRLIVDSSFFDSPEDFAMVRRIAEQTTTTPADLNWVRLEEWRKATATLFDPPEVRRRLNHIRTIGVVATSDRNSFGDSAESFLYAAWLTGQAQLGDVTYDFRTEKHDRDLGSLARVEIGFDDGSSATILHDHERSVLVANYDGRTQTLEGVTRVLSRGTEDLIIRQLKRPEADVVFVRVLPLAIKLAAR